ncbi:MAG: hypothetical protein ACYTHJ_08640 [Planctomycetota bacterium]|jgi:prepilin-type processing-associated H-X9-DG protein
MMGSRNLFRWYRALTPGVHQAFSILELLVVVGVLMLVLGILLPSLNDARKKAQRVTCLSNQRQIALAIQAYAQDYQDRLPIAHYFDQNRLAFVAWDTTTFAASSTQSEPGLIWEYVSGQVVQQCPTYDGSSNTPGDFYTGYNYNTSYLGRGQNEGEFKGMREAPAFLSEIRFSSTAAMIGDGGWAHGANKFMRAPGDSGAAPGVVMTGGQSYRHQGFTNVTFVDGHGRATRVKHQRANTLPVDFQLLGWPDNGFLSADDRAYAHR